MGRIVVNFEPGAGPAKARSKGRRWLKVLAILAVIFVIFIAVVVVAGFFAWRRYQSSPEYSLTLLVDAALRNDTAELAKLVDDDEVARNMLAAVNQKAIARYGGAIKANTQQQIDKLTPTLLPDLKPKIHDEIVQRIRGMATTPEPFYVLLVLVPRLVKVTTEGDLARCSSSVTTTNFDLTLHRDSDGWKVVAFNDDATVQRLVDSVMKDLPAIGDFDSNSPLFKNPGRSRKRNR